MTLMKRFFVHGLVLSVLVFLSGAALAEEAPKNPYEGEEAMLESLQPVFEQEEFDPNEQDEDGQVMLHAMASQGYMKIVQILVDKGADVTIADKNGVTPIFGGAQSGNVKLVKFLVMQGADVNHLSKDGVSVLDVVTLGGGKKEMIEYLKSQGAKLGKDNQKLQDALKDAPPGVGAAVDPGNMECMNSCQGLQGQAAQQCFMGCASGARDAAMPEGVQGGGTGAADSMMECLQQCQGGSPEAAEQCAASCTGQ